VDGPPNSGPGPGGHDLSAGGDVLDQVTACARAALRRYDCHPDASVELLNVSENATFLVSDPGAGPSVLRVHRLGYHTEQEIASELAWMDALRAEAGVRTPRVLAAVGGQQVVTVAENSGPARGENPPEMHRAR
jgi:Ser/Thr protein kinase RdoA (MazF antagonist)